MILGGDLLSDMRGHPHDHINLTIIYIYNSIIVTLIHTCHTYYIIIIVVCMQVMGVSYYIIRFFMSIWQTDTRRAVVKSILSPHYT